MSEKTKKKIDLLGRDIITTQELTVDEIKAILQLAFEMKKKRYSDKWAKLLERKTFIMLFYNPSIRTRQSFEAGATELGGHAQFMDASKERLKSVRASIQSAGETIHDAAKVMSRYAVGIGIRILETSVDNYGDGNKVLREYAKYANIPIINMADDMFHPCQGLADVMGMMEHNDNKPTRGKTLLQTWAKGALARSYCSVHESLLINSRLGLNINLAYPDDNYELPADIIKQVQENCKANGAKFEIIKGDPSAGYKGADYVYSRNWFGKDFYQLAKTPAGIPDLAECKKIEIKRATADDKQNWICSEDKMKLANPDCKFVHPMPVDEESEVTEEVNRGPRSIIIDIAENRLHVQKAIMAMTMAGVKVKLEEIDDVE